MSRFELMQELIRLAARYEALSMQIKEKLSSTHYESISTLLDERTACHQAFVRAWDRLDALAGAQRSSKFIEGILPNYRICK